jgi:Xaa-Pro aminopeptidase
VWQATEAGIAAAVPGARTCDVWRAMADTMVSAVAAQGGDLDMDAFSTGRLGHGLGLELTEWPSITEDDTTVLQAGMVMTIEPGMPVLGHVDGDQGKMIVHEENVVVREGGAEMLSKRAPREMATLPGVW